VATNSVERELDKVENFIKSLALPERIAKGVLFTAECCNSFYEGFYGRNNYVIDDLLDYREEKLSKSKITLVKFLDMCYNEGNREAFRLTFYQYFTSSEIEVVDRAIESGKTSLQSVYTDFEKNPNKNVLKNVL
jgi:hypothetical protein